MTDNQSPEIPVKVTRRSVLRTGASLLGLGLTVELLAGCSQGPGKKVLDRHLETDLKVDGEPYFYVGKFLVGPQVNRRKTPWIEDETTTGTDNKAYSLKDSMESEEVENAVIIKDGGPEVPEYGKTGTWPGYYSQKTNSVVWVMYSGLTEDYIKNYDSNNIKKCRITAFDVKNQNVTCNYNGQDLNLARSQIIQNTQTTR